MVDQTAEFFDRISQRGYEPLLKKVTGTIRFDLSDDQHVHHWFLEIRNGDLTVSHEERQADCVISTAKDLFDRVATGEASSIALWIRNLIVVRGQLPLLRLFERLLPDHPGSHDPRSFVRGEATDAEHGDRAGRETGIDEVGATLEGSVRILVGNTFVLSDGRGDIDASPASPAGLFSFDTRFLSRWHLSVNGQRLSALSVDELQYFETRFFLVPGTASPYIDPKLSVIRHRWLTGSFHEELTVVNHTNQPTDVTVRMDVGSDFADLFEVKGRHLGSGLQKKGRYRTLVEQDRLRLVYERETFRRETVISSTGAEIDDYGLTFIARIEPHSEWMTRLNVRTLGGHGRPLRESLQGRPTQRSDMRQELQEWHARAPRLTCDWEALATTYECSMIDLAALRYFPITHAEGQALPAAGLPWFATAFGRDAIFTSLQALPFIPDLAATTLIVLAVTQAASLDDFRDREPGKIMHEVRAGETSAFEEQPHSVYFGSADATPLYVVLLDEYELWSGDADLVQRLEMEARAALAWIDTYGNLLDNGYIWYQRRNTKTGLENQCWKDSPDSISYRDGRLPRLPRATCELQGYAYDAKKRGARLARHFWNDPVYADRLEREADDLKARFNRDFWVEDGQYYALGLDPDGRPVDALSSNIGHLLWSGIVEPSRAAPVAEHLLGPRLFSGWGVRTLANDQGRYNPVGYHVGTVWPFDNSFIAWGLRRYGFDEYAARIAESIIDAAQYFRGRLPEAFAGYDSALTRYPVEYPTACSPQAWSAGAPLLLLRTMLGLEPHGDHLVVDAALPQRTRRIDLLNIPGRWGKTDAFGRGQVEPGRERLARVIPG